MFISVPCLLALWVQVGQKSPRVHASKNNMQNKKKCGTTIDKKKNRIKSVLHFESLLVVMEEVFRLRILPSKVKYNKGLSTKQNGYIKSLG